MSTPEPRKYAIKVEAQSFYLEGDSDPSKERYVFAYRIRITNVGTMTAQLKSRHWIITDANMKVQEVQGPGVVGEFPRLQPNEAFEYTSGSHLTTSMGTMRGSYQMIADDGAEFEAEIPQFVLSIPRTLH